MIQGHNINDLNEGLDDNLDEIIQREVKVCQYVGEGFINNCRNLRTYRDVTGNLRASTGYVVAVNADVEIININGQTAEGEAAGRQLATKLANDKNATVLIGVAGMEYGVDVEARGKDVITGSGILARKELESMLNEI